MFQQRHKRKKESHGSLQQVFQADSGSRAACPWHIPGEKAVVSALEGDKGQEAGNEMRDLGVGRDFMQCFKMENY